MATDILAALAVLAAVDLTNPFEGIGDKSADIVPAIAKSIGASEKAPDFLDTLCLDVLGGEAWSSRKGEVDTCYDFADKSLFGFQSISKRKETVELTDMRFQAQVAALERATGLKFARGIYKPWSSGKFACDYASVSNATGEAYVFCHYAEAIGQGLVQWGARRPLEPQPKPDPFGAAYRAQWTDAFNAEIDARIEKYRKADCEVKIGGRGRGEGRGEGEGEGVVPAGTEVKVEQIESEFQIGCNIFNFDQLGDDAQNATYRAAFMKDGLFNAATVPFYWQTLEPEKGKPRYYPEESDDPGYWKTHGKGDFRWRRPSPAKVLDFCDANGVSVHGHVIIYPGVHPAWVNRIDDLDRRMRVYESHIAELAAFYKSRIPQWDIVNESADRASSAREPHDRMPWCNIAQPKDYTLKCFQAAERYFPKDVKLCINDAYTGPSGNGRYPAFMRKLAGQGMKFDVIGHQMHIFTDRDVVKVASGHFAMPNHISWDVKDQIAMLRQYDAFGKPVHVSEVTVPAPVSILPRAEAEALQARVLRDNYRLWFSWPSVYRISYWNAVDSVGGEILESGFFHRDMTKKPVYHALWKLVNEEWRTKTTVRADRDGVIRFRGFKGKYRLTWRDAAGRAHERLITLTDPAKVAAPRWITVDDPKPAADRTTEYVKTFVNRGELKKAVWTMTGLGVFDAYANGSVVGDDILKPGYTHHEKTKLLFEYNVLSLLNRGKGATNVLSAVQSGGWWSDRCVWGFKDGTKRKTAFRAELALTYADGTEERIPTDASWRAAYAGPVVTASIWDGETYDARIVPSWRRTGACDFPNAAVDDKAFTGEVVPLVGPKVSLRTDLTLRPQTMKVWNGALQATDTNRYGVIRVLREPTKFPVKLAAGEKLLLDFGQNAAAVPFLSAVARTGVKLVVRGCEMLNDGDGLKSRGNDGPGGSPYFTSYRSNRKTNFTYVFAGKGTERAMPRHTFFGYRYLQVEADGDVEIRLLASVPVSSVTRESELGSIVTGDASINRLVKNCIWGMYSNYLSVPTDCPQRDERQGWAGDTQAFALTATYLADVRGFLRKWMRDMRDTQLVNGGFAIVAPCGTDGRAALDNNIGRRIGWSDAGVIVPYTVWRQSGDATIVNENWDAMTRHLDLLEESKYRTVVGTNRWLDAGMQYGDWLSYERWESCANWEYLMTHHDAEDWWNFLGGCYWRLDAQMMAEMAKATGRGRDALRYEEMAKAALQYLRSEFLARDGLLLEKFRDMQTATLFALRTDLFAEPVARAKSIELLRANFAAHGGCLQTGFLGTSILMDVVTEHLGAKAAYDLLFQRKEPSWLFSVDNGATTMWERWNSYTKAAGFGKAGMNSFNHYAYGAVLGWIYKTAAGIASDPSAPGFKTIVMRPQPDRRLGFVKAEYKSAAGLVKSAWRYEGAKWIWDFTVPEGATAYVFAPGDRMARICKSGTYHIER